MAYYAVVADHRPVGVMPQTPLAGGVLRPRGIAGHTTEGGEGEAGWEGTVGFLIAQAARSASYHEGWYPKLGGFEARVIVDPAHAAHSMNPRQPPWRNPPFPRVARILSDRWWDPNAVSYAVAIAGSTGLTIPRLVNDPGFMAGARRRYAELLAQFDASLAVDPLFNHGEGQADRSDWGTFRAALLAVPPAQEDDMNLADWLPVEEDWTSGTGPDEGAFWTGGPGQGERKYFTTPTAIHTFQERRDGRWRIGVAEGIAEVLCFPRGTLRDPRNRRPAAPAYGYEPPVTGVDPAVAAARIYEAADATARAARRHADGYRPS